MDSGTEVEAKLALPGPVYWRLRDDPDLLGVTVVGRAIERQTNLFYDTPDGALRRCGAALRARKIAGRPGVEWTMKSGRRLAAGIQTADEVIAWGRDAEDPLGAAMGLPPVAAALRLADGPFRIDAASLADRLLLEVAAPSGGVIGVSLDRLRIPGDPVFVDYELEAEAHGASRSDVEALATDLIARFGLKPSTDSKRARIQAYADGGLGPPRMSAAEWLSQAAELAIRPGENRVARVALGGLVGSPIHGLTQDVETELTARPLGCQLTDSPDDWAGADFRIWVGSSVHWRLQRHLASADARPWNALTSFARGVDLERRELEWRWREADLVVADQPLAPCEQASSLSAGLVYTTDDLPPEVGGQVVLESIAGGSRLTFLARACPSDQVDLRHTFDLGAPAEWVAEALVEIGYGKAGK